MSVKYFVTYQRTNEIAFIPNHINAKNNKNYHYTPTGECKVEPCMSLTPINNAIKNKMCH